MAHYAITLHLVESHYRDSLPKCAGPATVIVEANSFLEALQQLPPAEDCYKVEIILVYDIRKKEQKKQYIIKDMFRNLYFADPGWVTHKDNATKFDSKREAMTVRQVHELTNGKVEEV